MLLFNCGNINIVTGLQGGTARKLSSISNRGKRFLYCQKHANRNWKPQSVLFSCPGVKELGREADKHQRYSPKMKNQPDVTALTLFIDSFLYVVFDFQITLHCAV